MYESRGAKRSGARYLVALSLLLLVAVVGHRLWVDAYDRGPDRPGREPQWRPAGLPPSLAPVGSGDEGEPGPAPEHPEVNVVVETNVPGAVVTLHLSTVGPRETAHHREAVADADGVAEFTLGADAVHVQTIIARASKAGYMDGEERVRFGRARIELSPGIAVRGTVRDLAGNPIARAWVHVTKTGYAFWTAVDGSFTLHVPESGRYQLHVEHPQYVGRTEDVDLASEALEFVLEDGLSVTGRVRLANGEPVVGVPVTAPVARSSAYTDEDGRYLLSGLPTGKIRISCDVSEDLIEAESGTAAPDFVIPGPLVRVEFRDDAGRRLCGVNVDIAAHASEGAEEDGAEYSFDNLSESEITRAVPPGASISVHASAPGFRTASWTSTGPIRTGELLIVRLEMRASGRRVLQAISVTRAGGGSPTHVVVRALRPDGALLSSEVVKLDASGRGLMTQPPEEAKDLSVRDLASPLIEAPLRTSAQGPATAIFPAGATILVVGSTLPPAGRLLLTSSAGTPLPVVFRPSVPSDRLPDRLRESPVLVSLAEVPPGAYRLIWTTGGDRSHDVALVIHDGAEHVVVRLD